jgi:hypothetical protein
VEEAVGDDAEVSDNVEFWRDQSGNNSDMQNNDGGNPTYNVNSGNYYIDFSGGSNYLQGSAVITGTSARTVFGVLQPTSLAATGSNAAFALAPNASAGAGYALCIEQPSATYGMGLRVSGNKMMNYTTSTTAPTIISTQADAGDDVTDVIYYANGTQVTSVQSQSANTLNTSSIGVILGGFSTGADNVPESTYDFNGYLFEIIAYNQLLNSAQRKLVENYLGAKYGITIGTDLYAYQASYNYDVAGIGRDDASNEHTAAQSDAMKVDNASSLGNGDYLLFGHDNGSIASWSDTDSPGTGIKRLAREWQFDETNEVGTIQITIDTANFPARETGYSKYLIAIDADGTFAAGATLYSLTPESGSLFSTSGIDITAGEYLTVCIAQNISNGSGDFNNTSTWAAGSVPGSGEGVTILNTHTITLTANQTVGSITINSGGELDIDSYTLTLDEVDGGFYVNAGGTFTKGTGTVDFAADGDQNVAGVDYYHLTMSESGTKTLNGNIDIDGDLNIATGVTLDCDASGDYNITLAGDWGNNGTFTAQEGTVTFNGTAAQSISNNAGSFYSMTVNKSSNDLTINNSVQVDNTLTMTSGDIILGNNNFSLGCSATISGGSSSSYFQCQNTGKIIKYYCAVPAALITVPTGDNNDYSPCTFDLNGGTLSSAYVSINLRDAVHPAISGISDYISRYWSITPSGITGVIDYDVSFTYTDADVIGNESNYETLKYSSSVWTYGGSVNAGSNVLSWNGLSSFSDYTGGDGGALLPIDLLSFEGYYDNGEVNLMWTTVAEQNNDYFSLEKSADGEEFVEFSTINGAGNSHDFIHYKVVDENPVEGISYYRLKQTDFDGKFQYFGPIAIESYFKVSNEALFNIYPNPIDEGDLNLQLMGYLPEERVTLHISTLFGDIIHKEEILIGGNGLFEKTISSTLFTEGMYVIFIVSEKGIQRQKLMVK